ncbi:hypothetical protein [Amycolatopsis suaedae]|uniref:Phage tail protein n=1 Tax=Amycolatopsis suaedae TaxID=2510978 RepID=A0A4Q7J0X0_9PSEU|nr:hypothetical protein [Amycolatopsis suaedae]RZQ60046.1 hypothetical protein EWH70_30520 [Amycolatopsis suaedae]
MTSEADRRLYDLLPRIYHKYDEERGGPMKALLGVVTEQADIVDADIDQLYADWFVETCQDWVVPYLGDLVGYRMLPGSQETLSAGTEAARRLLAAIASRRDVAHTVGNRRRKGTLALLEQLAADVAGWPARAVEFRRLLGVTQSVRLHGGDRRADARRLRRGRLVDVRDIDVLDRVNGPFDRAAHTVGRLHNIPEVGLHVWRLRPHPVTMAPAYCEDRARTHYTFSVLGNDTPLMTKPVVEPSPTHVADETNVPAFIRRRAFAERTAHYYGPGKSLCVYLEGGEPVPLNQIVPADLSGWRYRPRPGQVAVDPVLGRIAFPARHAPDTGVWVSYHHGFSAEMGGGEYRRTLDEHPDPAPYLVGPGGFDGLMAALAKWAEDKEADPGRREAIIEITDSGAYQEQIELRLDRGDRLTVRAAQGKRPVLRLLDWHSNRPDALRVNGTGEGDPELPLPRLELDGLLITGRSMRVQGPVGQVVIRHSTLVPGWSLDEHCTPEHVEEPSVELADTPACLEVDRSIVGTILVTADEERTEPNPIWLTDSIVDAAGPGLAAIAGPDDRHAHAVVSARRSTLFGSLLAHGTGTVENCLLVGVVRIARRQAGCFRFCWLPPESRTPPRFHCEPEHSGDALRVVPRFTSVRYGTPGYAQLGTGCAEEVRRGADDASEPGAFHDLFAPQREDNLRTRLEEYTPAGAHVSILFQT